MVNGQDLAKFWAVYQLHDRPHIRALLEEYRIGNLSSCDYLKVKRETNFESYYTNEPVRPQGEMVSSDIVPLLTVTQRSISMFTTPSACCHHMSCREVSVADEVISDQQGQLRSPSTHPWNSEPKVLARLTDTFFTPNDLFFTRNHNHVPSVDADDYVLEIEENVNAGGTIILCW